MIIEKILLENFRQYYGPHEIIFSTAKKKNVTVVHAENGFGKTALLNALLWAFYGFDGLTDDLEHKDRLIHDSLSTDTGDPECYAKVQVMFTDQSDDTPVRYSLTRIVTLASQRYDAKKSDIRLESIGRDGITRVVENPQWFINALIPEGVAPFLFFNGERIEQLSRAHNSSRITEAIHQMLGFKLLKTTIQDLDGRVMSHLNNELKKFADAGTAELLDSQANLLEDIEKLNAQMEVVEKNKAACIDEVETIKNQLKANEKVRKLQEERERLEREQKLEREKELDKTRQLLACISQDAYILFAEDLVKRGVEITNRLRTEGKIPARVLNHFLQELLDAQRCICSRPLLSESDERRIVEQLMTIAGDQEFNNAVAELDTAIGGIKNSYDTVKTTFRTLVADRLAAKTRINQLDQAIADITDKIGSRHDEEICKLESHHNDLKIKKEGCIFESGKLKQSLEQKKVELDKLKQQIAQIAQKEDQGRLAQRRVAVVQDTVNLLRTILDSEMKSIRLMLNDEIAKHFKKIIFKNFYAELTEDFVLRIRKRSRSADDLDVAKSTGESQVTSIVFIGSLLALAAKRHEIPTILKGLEGNEFPICMDSPFGNLGVEYREKVAGMLPRLAPQVIVFVSPTQWRGEVEKSLESHTGRQYYLVNHGPKIPEDASKSVTICGRRVTQFKEHDFEFTAIKELTV